MRFEGACRARSSGFASYMYGQRQRVLPPADLRSISETGGRALSGLLAMLGDDAYRPVSSLKELELSCSNGDANNAVASPVEITSNSFDDSIRHNSIR